MVLIQVFIQRSCAKSKNFFQIFTESEFLKSISVETFSKSEWDKHAKNPQGLIQRAWENNEELGSSTLVVVTLPKQGDKIYTSYIGDSGYIILRENNKTVNLVHSSESQQKGFNFPFQLGWNGNGDLPDKSLSYNHTVKTGDIVIAGTDGLFDNLSAVQVIPHTKSIF